MQIKIMKLSQCDAERFQIEFASKYGTAKGIWRGVKPEIGKSYSVELDIPQILCWGTDIVESDLKEPKIRCEKDKVLINAQIERLENDGCLAARLGESIFLVETQGIPYTQGTFIKMQPDQILLYRYL